MAISLFDRTLDVNAADLALAAFLAADETALQRTISRARAYHRGDQPIELTDEQLTRLGELEDPENAFTINISELIVGVVCERLIVEGFACDDDAARAAAAAWWTANQMATRQDDVHEFAVRDRESFVIVDWDPARSLPRFTPQPRFVDAAIDEKDEDGGWGCKIFYPDDDPAQPATKAVKRWVEYIEAGTRTVARQRMTIYYPDRVERYVMDGRRWVPFEEDEVNSDGSPVLDADGRPVRRPWPEPWVDAARRPLGVALVQFRNAPFAPEALSAWNLNRRINHAHADLTMAEELTAFRIYKALGFYPTSDGKELASDESNRLRLRPGSVVGTTAKPNEAEFDVIEGANPSPLADLIERRMAWSAALTRTPVHRFIVSGQVARSETQQEYEAPLVTKCERKQVRLGGAWAQVMELARRVANAFGAANLREDAPYAATWRPARARPAAEIQAEWQAKSASLHIPDEQLWAEAGYTPKQIETMQEMPSYKDRSQPYYPVAGDGDDAEQNAQ